MRRGGWPVLGLVVGAVGGWLWGWFGGGYERLDSAIGTSFLCALAGLLVGAIVWRLGGRG